ncbi:stemmadenine O-acetyltransferase-like [Gastrolobium bilobum]|uniref:stemmadenine O-acetyltransferase-like n=1 Tax=Gastrolobium bilobum TaxID=150636 RepID=UPI002AB2356F|nr:stemmadenine O-acetyltransferase-like [Gastrolobium bilobum]
MNILCPESVSANQRASSGSEICNTAQEKMATKAEIVSKDTIKPSSPTPNHLRDFKISLLDQLAPPIYVPVVLFYSASDVTTFGNDIRMISDKLKSSLSDILTLYYPFCGTLKGNSLVDCNDVGVLYVESKVPTKLSNILKNPQVHEIIELFPFDPYNPLILLDDHSKKPASNMAVQVNEFSCGGIGIGVCFSHKIADGSTAASFLNAWAATSRGQHGNNILEQPQIESASLLFPPRNINMDITRGMTGHKNIVTRRFIFNDTNLSRLREKLGCFNPTRVEAVTALIWKSATEAARASSSMVSHAVNIRSRMASPLSKNLLGNLWQQAASPVMEMERVKGLHDLAEIVRKTIRKVDADYVSKLQGHELPKVIESLHEARIMVSEKGISCYSFSSWIRFDFYEADFGWGKPTWVCTIGVPIKNVVILMATKNGDGIEAWVTLTEHDMVEFERNPELLEFASFDF